jgi:hypothetical protein
MSAIEEIEKRVLALPLEQRVFLAESLLGSVPPIGEEMTQAEEMREVERRDLEIESGHVRPLSEAEFWRNVQADAKQ